jgi:hypothetical protein
MDSLRALRWPVQIPFLLAALHMAQQFRGVEAEKVARECLQLLKGDLREIVEDSEEPLCMVAAVSLDSDTLEHLQVWQQQQFVHL